MTQLGGENAADVVRAAHAGAIGRTPYDLVTPALLLDAAALQRNVDSMARKFKTMPALLRPHVKGHKNIEIARLQIAAGAAGVTAATPWEALMMARGGIDDVLVANEVVGPEKLRALAEAASSARITVAVDSLQHVELLSAEATSAGVEFGVVVEVDIGMRRCGVRSSAEALKLVEKIVASRGLGFRGVEGYEGHCTHLSDPVRRNEAVREALATLMAAADDIVEHGHACDVVSAGGTGTYETTGTYPGITEVQAGSYVFMDGFHRTLTTDFEVALTVASSVISRGAAHLVLDAGRKAVAIELGLPTIRGTSMRARSLSEEHATFDLDSDDVTARVGDVFELVPGYAPSTVNMYDVYHVIRDGVVVDIWPVGARGPGRSPF
jgi:D-serine deaminase-like pyridoxal phosphate-dependent protein